jgi:hypothetical protein
VMALRTGHFRYVVVVRQRSILTPKGRVNSAPSVKTCLSTAALNASIAAKSLKLATMFSPVKVKSHEWLETVDGLALAVWKTSPLRRRRRNATSGDQNLKF